MLWSILAQLEFTHLVKQYDESGVPFRMHLHVPEVHPDTKTVFLEREDEGHVLKVRHIMLLDHAVMVDAHLCLATGLHLGGGVDRTITYCHPYFCCPTSPSLNHALSDIYMYLL